MQLIHHNDKTRKTKVEKGTFLEGPQLELLGGAAVSLICDFFKVSLKEILDIAPLKHGMTNDSFLFTVKGKRYIIRIPGRGTKQLINRVEEKAVYDVVQALPFIDPIVYIDAHSGYKITRFIENAHTLDPTCEEELRICIKSLKDFHHKNFVVNHSFDVFEHILYYHSLFKAPSIYEDHEEVTSAILSLKQAIDGIDKKCTLCHIDAVCDNFLLTKNREVYLIDFEYAGMQDPDLDLAMFAVYSMVDRKALDNIISLYHGHEITELLKYKIYAYVAMTGLLWSNWCEVKHQKGADFGAYALGQYLFAKNYYSILCTEATHLKPFAYLRGKGL